MRVEAVELRQLEIPMVEPLAAAHGVVHSRLSVLVHVMTDVGEGWGECSALNEPTYSGDWSSGEYAVLQEFFIPALLEPQQIDPFNVLNLLERYKQHHPAKAAVELAVLDAQLRSDGVSLAKYFGVDKDRVDCSVVIGFMDEGALLRSVERKVADGYRDVKLKIAPHQDVERIDAVKKHFPDLALRADANGAYYWDNADHRRALAEIDERGLAFIEQPLPAERTRWYVELREQMQSPICLDESVSSLARGLAVLESGLCDVVGIKPGMIGGYSVAKELHDACRQEGIATSLGGMIDTGVARAANLAIAGLPGFANYPSELAPDGRWFSDRLTLEPVDIEDGTMKVPNTPGAGFTIDQKAVNRLTRRQHVARRSITL